MNSNIEMIFEDTRWEFATHRCSKAVHEHTSVGKCALLWFRSDSVLDILIMILIRTKFWLFWISTIKIWFRSRVLGSACSGELSAILSQFRSSDADLNQMFPTSVSKHSW